MGGKLIVACFPPFCPAFFRFPFFRDIRKTVNQEEEHKKAHFDVRYPSF